MKDIASTLCTHTYTKADLDRRIGLLRASLEHVLYEKGESDVLMRDAVLSAAKAETDNETDLRVIAAWYESLWKDVQGSTLRNFVVDLEKQAHALPLMELYVPVALDEESLASLSTWYRKEVTPNTLFVLHINPEVVGGCGFVSQDTYQEYTLRSALEANAGLITKLITSYA